MLLGSRIDGPEDAPPLVLLGSLGGTADLWTPVLDRLTSVMRVVRVDHRGHGKSPPATPGDDVVLADLGADVLETLDGLGLPHVDVAGISLGGMVAIWLAAHHPDRVGRLGLLCTAAHLPPPEGWYARAATVRADGMSAIAATVVGRWVTEDLARRDPTVPAQLRAAFEGVDAESYAQCCTAIATMDQRPDLDRITAPTLVVGAAQDRSTPVEHARSLAGAIGGARLEIVDDAAHIVVVEQPVAVADLMLAHFTADTRGART